MVEDPVLTAPFKIMKNEDGNTTIKDVTDALQDLTIDSSTKATFEDKLKNALRDLGITEKCHGFVIDGDMAIKMADYFNKEHPGSRSVRWTLKLC